MKKSEAIEFLSDENTNALQVILVKLISNELDSYTFPEKSKEFDDNFKKLIEGINKLPNNIIPYSQIAQAVYQIKNQGDDLGIEGVLNVFKKEIVNYINKQENDEIDGSSNILIKIYEHIVLSDTQMNALHSDQSSQVSEIGQRLNQVQSSYISSIQEWDNIKGKLDSMYSNFVSVLGIFVAISFTLFSAASLVKEILTISNNPTKIEIGSKIMLSGITVILIYLLIVGLFQGITVVTRQYYFFSIRKLYIICMTAGSIILFGYVFGHDVVSWSHAVLLVGFMVIYILIASLGYAFGYPIKKILIKLGKPKHR